MRANALLCAKTTLRQELKQRRASVAGEVKTALQTAILDFAAHPLIARAANIALYWPLPDEVDPRTLIAPLLKQTKILALPCVVGKNLPLIFRRYTQDTPLVEGAFHTQEPPNTAPVTTPDLIITPLLGFDRACHRLGYGGGFYDRTLAALRASAKITAIGLGYACQEVPSVPVSPHDQPLDGVLTEHGLFTRHT